MRQFEGLCFGQSKSRKEGAIDFHRSYGLMVTVMRFIECFCSCSATCSAVSLPVP